MYFIDLTVMNVLTKELNNGFHGLIVDNSKPKRVLQCRDCNSIEVHNQKFFSIHNKPCMGGCGFGTKGKIPRYTVKDLVPLPIKCKNCGNQKGFNFPDDSGVEEAELVEHEMYAKAKATMLKAIEEPENNNNTEILSDLESDIAEDTQLAENRPRVKGLTEEQVYTIEPKDGFDSSGIVENEMYFDQMCHTTAYYGFVNFGNTPHMIRKIPMRDLIGILSSRLARIAQAWFPQTYGNAQINRDCKAKMGFSVECLNKGNRRLSDNRVKALLSNVYFGQEKVKALKEAMSEMDYITKKSKDELEKAEEYVLQVTSTLKTGQEWANNEVKEYRDNTYDPMTLEKLGMELDIPWKENLTDVYKIAKASKPKPKRKNAKAHVYWNTNKYIPNTKKKGTKSK
jgi:formate dehydrogenase maturation protein FdhE